MKITTSILFSIILLQVIGQTPLQEIAVYQKKYPFTKVVKLQDEMIMEISLDKEEKLTATKTIIETDLILDKKASLYNSNTVQYSELIALNYIKAKSLFPDVKKYVEHKVSEGLITTKD